MRIVVVPREGRHVQEQGPEGSQEGQQGEVPPLSLGGDELRKVHEPRQGTGDVLLRQECLEVVR